LFLPVCVVAGAAVWWALAVRPASPAGWLRDKKAAWNQRRLAGQCVRKLQWLETASAADAARKDADAKRYRFYSCFGESWNTPGVEFIDYVACCKPAVRIEEIEGTRDRALSAEHERLMDMAYRFAREYNKRMRELLDTNGLSRCAPAENWGKAFSELSSALGGESGNSAVLGMPVTFDVSRPSFEIAVRDGADAHAVGGGAGTGRDPTEAGSIRKAALECLSRNGIARRVDFHVSRTARVEGKDSQVPAEAFACENGKVFGIK
jgi:hypothetical protein